ncbi:hypothetical protein [Aureimonas jatrophae]|nr:hypothetical protein [Aureimonas jatrophae]
MLPVGLALLLAIHFAVVLWLDLPLWLLAAASILVPLAIGAAYNGRRVRFQIMDCGIGVLFASVVVAAMNAVLGWMDGVPAMPSDVAAWQETLLYASSIWAFFVLGMLLRTVHATLAPHGATSLARVRGLLHGERDRRMDPALVADLSLKVVGGIATTTVGILGAILGRIFA